MPSANTRKCSDDPFPTFLLMAFCTIVPHRYRALTSLNLSHNDLGQSPHGDGLLQQIIACCKTKGVELEYDMGDEEEDDD